jgi:hypothetical protein
VPSNAKSPAAKVNLGATMIGAGVAPAVLRSKPAGGGKEQAAAAALLESAQPMLEKQELLAPAVSQVPVRAVAEPVIASMEPNSSLSSPRARLRSEPPPRIIDAPLSPAPEPLKLHTHVAGHNTNAAASTMLDYASGTGQPHVAEVVDPAGPTLRRDLTPSADHRYLPGDPMAPQPTAANRGSARLRLPNDELPTDTAKNERVWLYWAVCGVVVFSVMVLAIGFGLFG